MISIKTDDFRIKGLASLNSKLSGISRMKAPDFALYREDISKLKTILGKYRKFKNLIVIANGGSHSSFRAFHHALIPMTAEKQLFILTSMEPDLIDVLRVKFSPKDTLIMPISKSGNTVGVIESLLAFKDYKVLPITSVGKGALWQISKSMGWEVIPHPDIGGRFSGMTASAYAPALFFDIDVEEIDKGLRSVYKVCDPSVPVDKNPALRLASYLFLLEKKGFLEIFCPVYSHKLLGFSLFLMQIIHETVGKQGRGQTIYVADAPESQHHTNQRFFGGHRNVVGLFVSVENEDDQMMKIHVDDKLAHIKLRDGSLRDLDNVPYHKSFEFELLGTYNDAINNKIPVGKVLIDRIDAFNIGEFLGFWHYVAVYSAMLRNVDPFDQPQVESSKAISFELRKQFNKD